MTKSTGLWVVKSDRGLLAGVKLQTKKKEIVPSEMEVYYGHLDATPFPMMFKEGKEYAEAWALNMQLSGIKWHAHELTEKELESANKVLNS